MVNKIYVAVDGPSGSGKGVFCKGIANHLGANYLDAGSFHRSFSYMLDQRGISPQDFRPEHLEEFDLTFSPEGLHIDGNLMERYIRTQRVGDLAKEYATRGEGFKTGVIQVQRRIVDENPDSSWVCDGRTTATDIVPDAHVKIYFWADPQVRGERRFKQLRDAGKHNGETVGEITEKLIQRDLDDYNNQHYPFSRLEEAHVDDGGSYHHIINSGDHTIDSQLEHGLQLIEEAQRKLD